MWKWSKDIVGYIKEADCVSTQDLLNIEIGTRLLTEMCVIQGLIGEDGKADIKIIEDKIDSKLYNWAEGILEAIKDSKCLSEQEFNFVRLSMLVLDIHNALLNEHLQLDKTDKFDLQCSPYIKRD